MIRKTAIAVGIGSAVLLSGAGTALAAENAPTAALAASTVDTPAHQHHHGRVFRGEIATWTTFDKKSGTTTVHDGIRGMVTAVSSSSITVKAASGTADTFAVGDTTKVHAKGGQKGSAATIGQVKVGDTAIVVGTGTGTLTATHIIDRGVPAASPAS